MFKNIITLKDLEHISKDHRMTKEINKIYIPIIYRTVKLREQTIGVRYRDYERIKYILKNSKKSSLILDVGCGFGEMLLDLAHNGRKKLIGIDIDGKKLLIAKLLFQRKNKKCLFIKCAAENLPFKNNFFDVCYCCQIIEHVNSPEKTIGEMYRVTKTKGSIIVICCNVKGIFRYLYTHLIKGRVIEKIPKIKKFPEEHYINTIGPFNNKTLIKISDMFRKIPILNAFMASNIVKIDKKT